MAKIIPITEHFQHFLAELKESLWGERDFVTRLGTIRLRIASTWQEYKAFVRRARRFRVGIG
jgi:hypothetical protein